MSRLRFTSAAVAALALAVAACGGSDASPTTPIGVGNGGSNNGGGTGNVGGGTVAVANVALSRDSGTVFVGRTLALSATARDASGNALAGRAVTWTSSAEAVARVDANGMVTGVAPGSATITAASEGKTASAAVTVQPAPAASIVIAPDTATLALGGSVTLAATVKDDQGATLPGRVVRWSSSAPAVASVDSLSGAVRAVGGGSATITATSEGKSGAARITVRVPVATVSVTTALDTLEAWDTIALSATTRDANGNVLTGRVIRWTSSNPTVAAVDSVTGELTGFDRGTVTVTATSEGKSGTASRVVVIKYRSISAGTEHACDIASGGIVWCWGRNGSQLRVGLPNADDRSFSSTPVKLNTDVRFKQLSTFGTTTCGLARDGRAYCWGYDGWGNLGNGGSSQPSATPVAVAGGLTFKQISLGAQQSCAVTTDDKVYCWGYNGSSEFGNNNTASSSTPVLAASGMSFASIGAGNDVTCGVTAAGQGYCWGHNGAGQLGDGLRISGGNTYTRTPSAIVGGLTFRSVHASQSYTCGVTVSGQGWCWGSGGSRFGSDFSAETSTPRAIPGYSWKQIAPGSQHACGITTNDDLFCWGSNTYGQLGNPVGANGTTSPIRAAGSLKAAEVSAANIATGSAAYTCTVSLDRLTTYCFGKNDFGQLGNGSTTAAATPNPTATIVVGQKPLPVTR